MMEMMKECIRLLFEMSPYLLLGFFIAGLMHAFVPTGFYRRYLARRGMRSVLHATLMGIPLPLCSCGVIPTAMSLRREGASRGATTAFLIATPQTGVDSILATYSLMGLPFALLRPVVALLTALGGGVWVDRTDHSPDDAPTTQPAAATNEEGPHTLGARIKVALRYAFVDMVQDIGKWLVAGLLIAGLITVYVPDTFFALFAGRSLPSILLVLLLSIPMYLCATGSIPIAVALMLKGLTPGAALVLLMAGPACNMASILVIGKVMGRRTLWRYLLTMVGGAVGFGLVIDWLLPAAWFVLPAAGGSLAHCAQCSDGDMSWPTVCLGFVMCTLLAGALVRRLWEAGRPREAKAGHRYRIEGMECNHCRTNVEKAVRSVAGVTLTEASLATGEVRVEGTYDEEELLRRVRALGFKAERL